MFGGAHKPLRAWFRAIWYVTDPEHKVTALALGEALDLKSYRTAWAWMQKIRGLMAAANVPGYERVPRKKVPGGKGPIPAHQARSAKAKTSRGLRFYRVLKHATKEIV